MGRKGSGVDTEIQEKPSTFWTQCPICWAKLQYYTEFLDRLLRCQICHNTFQAREFLEDVDAEALRNQCPNHKEPPKQCPQDPPNTFWTQCSFCCAKFQYYSDTLGRLLCCQICQKAFEAHELKNDVHPEFFRNQFSNTVEPPKQGPSNLASQDLRKGQSSGVAEKKRNIGAAGVHKKEARENVSFPLDKNFPNKKRKTEEFELKAKEATMLDKEESNFKADVSSAANVATLESIEVPDPQFHKFVVDADMLANLCQANQTWALYDTADGMPRFYAIVKKVLTPGFKLKVSWLDADPDDQGEIDWCEKELPVACGKFRLGDSAEITDHLMFSHQMHATTGSLTGSVLVYPRKGETWAIYQNWDIGWSSEPEKHVSYKYEFVEVLSDFVEGDGIGVSYLGKVKGFVSLFQQTEQHGFQVQPDELYRFSHRIPSFKMTGHEGFGVPSGSFELDPASLPSSILIHDVRDLEIDNRRKNTEPSDLSGEFVERLVL
ncbi:uncharacterized protein LOC133729993 [Rosa rugosa]|uniref:uncharacterized protein LOC133729993 n=1 Tax=Rosa rugosa TaxID=74645 RepID=UPI002B414F77|nr:uncharacterized protein LOC133729993 [Rosa rugosa]XP_062013602.1 uncharacterized protein LOC133729993 [Rosa rugosa]XP_062013603.1 uncharacterized protein LOC133729993 [Rosa rugosa]